MKIAPELQDEEGGGGGGGGDPPSGGTRVRTSDPLEKPRMKVAPVNLRRRQPGVKGTLLGPVANSEGNVYWVQHDTGEIAPYTIWEIERLVE